MKALLYVIIFSQTVFEVKPSKDTLVVSLSPLLVDEFIKRNMRHTMSFDWGWKITWDFKEKIISVRYIEPLFVTPRLTVDKFQIPIFPSYGIRLLFIKQKQGYNVKALYLKEIDVRSSKGSIPSSPAQKQGGES